MKPLLLLLLALGAAVSARAEPPCWHLAPAQSHLQFTGDQAGAPARGEFTKFAATICFDPQATDGQLRVVIETGSLDTHNSRRDEVLKGQDFFAVARYPQAVYEAKSFHPAGAGKFVADGQLTLRGVTRSVPVTFSFDASGGTAHVQGKVEVDRTDFGVGQGRWGDPRWVGKQVAIDFDLQLQRGAGAAQKSITSPTTI